MTRGPAGAAAVLLLTAGLAAAGCSGSPGQPVRTAAASCPAVVSTSTSASHSATASASAAASASTSAGPGFAWPTGIPADLPLPSGARLGSVDQLASGFTVVTFTAPGTVRSSLLQATAALRSAGFAVGRGSVGVSESRLPFTRDGAPGVLELTAVDACTTRWRVQA